MPLCPTCDEHAENKAYRHDSIELPAGPAIRVCHGIDGVYIHVLGDD